MYTVLAEPNHALLCSVLCSIQYIILCILHSVFSAVISPGRQQAGTSLQVEQATGLGREKERLFGSLLDWALLSTFEHF